MPSPNRNQPSSPPPPSAPESAAARRTFIELLHRPTTAWTILLISILLTGLGWWVSRSYVEQRAQERFNYEVDRAEELIKRRMLEFERMMIGARGLHYASEVATREQWQNYVAALRLAEYYPGVQGFGFVRWVTAGERAAYEARVRAEGFPGFAITPPGEREEYACVTYIEPFEQRNLRAFGYDLWSETVRQAGLSRARDTGLPALTGKMFLVQETETDVQPGVIMLVPMYRQGQPLGTVEERRAALFGWVHAPFRMRDLMQGILGNANPEIGFNLFDGEQSVSNAHLFDSDAGFRPVPADFQPSRTETRRIELAGRTWTLNFHSRPSFETTPASSQPFLIAVGGLAINGLLFAIIGSLAGLRRRAEQMAGEMTVNYRRANHTLGEVIAGHEQTEAALRASEERWRLIIATEPECVKLLGPDGSLLQMNPAGLGMIEAGSFEQVANQCVYPLVVPEDRAQFQELTERVFRGESGTLEFQLTGLKGTTRWLETHATPLRNEQGEVTSLLAVTRDITERKQAEEELQLSQSRLRTVIEGMPVMIHAFDDTSGLAMWNAECERVTGFRADEVVGNPDAMKLLYPDAAYREKMLKEWQAPSDEYRNRAWEVTCKDGTKRTIEWSNVSSRLPIAGWASWGVGVDVTDRLKLEATLRQAQKMESIGTLAGGIAHDFNNILGAIVCFTELARQDAGPGHPAQESLDQIATASERAANLVRQILTFSRKTVLEKRLLNLGATIEEDIRLLRATLPAGVELITRFAEDVPQVRADPTEVHQVVVNLGTNAWHALDGGTGRITLSLEVVTLNDPLASGSTGLRPGRYVRLTMSDTGKGMDTATLERIFDPFFTTKATGQGTGLGLSVVHGIMKSHNGTIRVTSQPGQGATFELYFPAAPEEPPSAPVPATPVELPTVQGQHILFLDDEEPLVRVATRTLGRRGYRVTGFTRVVDALGAFRAAPGDFDLIVTDYNMPGTSGIEIAREAKQLRPGLPVVLTSGYITAELQSEANAVGVRWLLPKPYWMEEFCRLLQDVLQPTPNPCDVLWRASSSSTTTKPCD